MVYQALEVVDELWVVEVRLVAGEGDDLAIAVDRLAVIAFGLIEPAETFITVMRAGEACQHVVGGLLGLVEFPGVACLAVVCHPRGPCIPRDRGAASGCC